MSISETATLQHKQACADKLQAIVEQQIIVGRQIQKLNYKATPDLAHRMNSLIDDYAKARTAYIAAAANCDVPVYVTPIQYPL
jgi:hypothetical protein